MAPALERLALRAARGAVPPLHRRRHALGPTATPRAALRLVDERRRRRGLARRGRLPAAHDGMGDPPGHAHRSLGRLARSVRGVPAVSFLNPLFLFGLAAAAIPVIIHLFTRRRPKEVLFPSLEFLTEVNQSEIRRLKLKQWLLLLLRTLAILALALAMSRPALKGTIGIRGGAA